MKLLEIQPIPNERALFIGGKKILVIADLHIGIEKELREHGINAPSQTKAMTDQVVSLCKKYKPKKIILLGDIKHNIPSSTIQEYSHLVSFIFYLEIMMEIYINYHQKTLLFILPKVTLLRILDLLMDIGGPVAKSCNVSN